MLNRLPMKRLKIPKILGKKAPRNAPGAAPGTLTLDTAPAPPKVTRIIYDADGVKFDELTWPIPDGRMQAEPQKIVWIAIEGIGDIPQMRCVAEQLSLHLLTVEDIAHLHQRPKHEIHQGYQYTVLRAMTVGNAGDIENEQISLIRKKGLLVTFQERQSGLFDPVRQRLNTGRGPIRKKGVDYLFYTLVDAIIDNYFPVLETYDDTMDQLEDALREDVRSDISQNIHAVRHQLRRFRRMIWPLRDMLDRFTRNDPQFEDDTISIFFRDCYDHVIQVADFVEGSRERTSELGDLYLSMMSEKTNQVMKLLTIISTIFIPLTFLCGVYGMNFDPDVSPYNMPELKWPYAYPLFWGVMVGLFFSMLYFFWRKGWLSTKR